MNDSISNKLKYNLFLVLNTIYSLKSEINIRKQNLNNNKELDIISLFHLIDSDEKGYITKEDMKDYLKYNGIYCFIEEILAFMNINNDKNNYIYDYSNRVFKEIKDYKGISYFENKVNNKNNFNRKDYYSENNKDSNKIEYDDYWSLETFKKYILKSEINHNSLHKRRKVNNNINNNNDNYDVYENQIELKKTEEVINSLNTNSVTNDNISFKNSNNYKNIAYNEDYLNDISKSNNNKLISSKKVFNSIIGIECEIELIQLLKQEIILIRKIKLLIEKYLLPIYDFSLYSIYSLLSNDSKDCNITWNTIYLFLIKTNILINDNVYDLLNKNNEIIIDDKFFMDKVDNDYNNTGCHDIRYKYSFNPRILNEFLEGNANQKDNNAKFHLISKTFFDFINIKENLEVNYLEFCFFFNLLLDSSISNYINSKDNYISNTTDKLNKHNFYHNIRVDKRGNHNHNEIENTRFCNNLNYINDNYVLRRNQLENSESYYTRNISNTSSKIISSLTNKTKYLPEFLNYFNAIIRGERNIKEIQKTIKQEDLNIEELYLFFIGKNNRFTDFINLLEMYNALVKLNVSNFTSISDVNLVLKRFDSTRKSVLCFRDFHNLISYYNYEANERIFSKFDVVRINDRLKGNKMYKSSSYYNNYDDNLNDSYENKYSNELTKFLTNNDSEKNRDNEYHKNEYFDIIRPYLHNLRYHNPNKEKRKVDLEPLTHPLNKSNTDDYYNSRDYFQLKKSSILTNASSINDFVNLEYYKNNILPSYVKAYLKTLLTARLDLEIHINCIVNKLKLLKGFDLDFFFKQITRRKDINISEVSIICINVYLLLNLLKSYLIFFQSIKSSLLEKIWRT